MSKTIVLIRETNKLEELVKEINGIIENKSDAEVSFHNAGFENERRREFVIATVKFTP